MEILQKEESHKLDKDGYAPYADTSISALNLRIIALFVALTDSILMRRNSRKNVLRWALLGPSQLSIGRRWS